MQKILLPIDETQTAPNGAVFYDLQWGFKQAERRSEHFKIQTIYPDEIPQPCETGESNAHTINSWQRKQFRLRPVGWQRCVRDQSFLSEMASSMLKDSKMAKLERLSLQKNPTAPQNCPSVIKMDTYAKKGCQFGQPLHFFKRNR